ncbi:iron chelate uptake ABC transporter family permease subunit [Actinomadura madurae]|uniref:FecCD family ABC transporter permease n=1 Tax=Actinomadura madurae TaxID=1993 RepID=UPI002026C555|nr:iron chelate uptake ABC transporter family permease subunit [Actinomadura madurae]MCP9947085.1 iron chelate uptake ABC transporter family permease subunit [Actinomadura madurae]MCP9976323.1 iron chelate uptake ABC transporter family permease subunit [Actinomadura madurae]MCQ0012519.1 iron chelate uptake ABC transporter family permease subunit [Actinomadura madurae]URM92935.1 iron chelate uptake ABC transporter family permease subunit [Actinomadura madurae]
MKVIRAGGLSLRWEPRSAAVCVGLAAFAACAAVLVVGSGEFPISPPDVVRVLAGQGDRATEFIVTTLRLPRAVTGLLAGLALGLSGAIFQSISRNPLGSPDLIGFTTGAATGALLQILVFGGGAVAITVSSVGGAVLTALAVYLVAYRRGGGVHGVRLVLIGVAAAAMLEALNAYLITRAELREAYEAAFWLTGSLNGRDWDQAVPLGLALAVLVPAALVLARSLGMGELGDDAAQALGVPVQRTRALLMIVGVGLVAAATAAAGPVPFVALAAPQLARRMTRRPGAQLLPAALTGAALLAVSDLISLRLPTAVPVGVVTGVLGGVYLAWLLAAAGRRR